MNVDSIIHLKIEEEVLQVVRESLIPHIGKFGLLCLWFLVPFFFMFPLLQIGIFGIIAFGILILSAMILILRAYRIWAFTVLVITDLRIVDIDQKGLFDRVVTEAVFPEIEEVNYRTRGFFATIFRYGILKIKMHGSSADFEFHFVKNPSQVHDLINDLRAEHA